MQALAAGVLAVLGGLLLLAAARRRAGPAGAEPAASSARPAMTDVLTGLPNRRGLAQAFEARRGLLSERDLVLTLLLLDLDHFRSVNDSDGHAGGDAALIRVAEVLREAAGEGDIAGRLGGDEFLLILTAPRYRQQGAAVGDRLLERLRTDPRLACLTVPVTASIGATTVWKAATTFAEGLKQADLALAEAKREGRDRQVDYRPEMGERHARRRQALGEVTRALRSDDVVPAYQPVLSLGDGALVGVEALARLRGASEGGMTENGVAAAFADARLGTMLSERVLSQALVDAGQLRRAGRAFGRLAVNLSEAQLAAPGFAEDLLDRLLLAGLSPHELTLELTDDVLRTSREAGLVRTLDALSEAGVRIALDDFGAGCGTLAHLLRLPVHQVKLDGAIVRDMVADPRARAVVAATVRMAHDLGLTVVAEGVETTGIDAALREVGCDFGQGLYYAPPIPLQRLERRLAAGRAA